MTICNMVPANMSSYTWMPPTTLVPGNIYRVKISSLSNVSGFDFSDNNFEISTGSITVVSPNGGETWYKGATYQILWTDNLCSDVRIELWKSGAFHSVIAAYTPSNGSYTWSIPNATTLIPGNDYKVKILRFMNSSTYSTVYDFSDNDFTISGGYFITVTSPNGGEVWLKGTTRIITWQDNIPWNVRIELWKGGVYNSLITASTPSTGSCYWAIPATIASGNDYKVKIMAVATNANLYDFSDNNFYILGVTVAANIFAPNNVIIYPNPCDNKLHLKFQEDLELPVTIEVLDMQARVVMNKTLQDIRKYETVDLNTTGLQPGKYMVVTRRNNELFSRNSFIVAH